jgi:hypothetical protein
MIRINLDRLPQWTEDAWSAALLFIVCAGLAMCMPPHNDTWWHLRAGLEMVRTGGILATESFSHTAYGTPLYHNHEWVTQLLFYGLFLVGGPLLLAAAVTVSALAALVGAWKLVRGSADAKVGWLALLFLGTVPEWAIRPQVISLALFVLAIHLAVSTRGHDRWLPVLCLIWANLHAVAIAGVLIAVCLAIEAVLWSPARVRRSLLIAAGCVAAPLCTPLGWHYWPRLFEVVRLARALGIHEYRSAFELAQIPFWVVVATFAALVVRERVLADADRSTRILVLVATVFAVAGAMSVRNIPMFALAAAPAMSRLLPAATAVQRVRALPAGGMIFLVIFFGVVTGVVTYAWRDRGAHLGWVPISSSAIEAIRQCKGPLFNGFADGGTLTWFVPDRPVFIDSRGIEAYPLNLLQRSRNADLSGDYDRLFKEFHIHCVAVAKGSIMAMRLAADPLMREQYSDPQWAVFTTTAATE